MIEFLTVIFIKVADTVLGWTIGKTLDQTFPNLFGRKNKEIIELYEKRLKEKDQAIEKKERHLKRTEKKHQKSKEEADEERKRIIDSLKRRSISTNKLIEKYDDSLNAIVFSYSNQGEIVDGKTKSTKFIREAVEPFNAKYLGGTDVLIPPSKVPVWIKNQNDLKKWFERNILKGRYCKVKFLVLFDLKKKAFWENYLPYQQKRPNHFSIGEQLSVDDLFTEEQINKISLGEIIREGDIAWLASTILSGDELERVLRNQGLIEKKLGKPSLRIVAQDDFTENLSEVLKEYVAKSDELAQAIVDEAKFWHDKLQG